LGVSAKERIARGQGDTPSHFGKRTFTNARTYREYAAERGLPDLDERLNNDNPKRYLRPGESVADIQKQVKTWTLNGKNPIVISKPDWEVVTGIKSNMELTGYDAAAKFKNEFNIQINNYEKIDDRVMTAVYTSMNKVVGKIPGITKYISNIDFTKLPAGIAAEAHYSFINLSVVVFKNMEHLKNTMARTVADGFFPKGIKDHSIFTHEIGHVVVNYLKLEVERITKDRKYLTGDKIISLIKKEAKKRCSIKFNYTSDEIKNLVSGYSTYNANELIAEAFSEYMDSDAPRPVAKSIGEVIEEMVHQVNNGQWNFK
jgi:hypothetical protein